MTLYDIYDGGMTEVFKAQNNACMGLKTIPQQIQHPDFVETKSRTMTSSQDKVYYRVYEDRRHMTYVNVSVRFSSILSLNGKVGST